MELTSIPLEIKRSKYFCSKSPPTIEIIDGLMSNIEALKPIYVPAPPRIFPDDSVGVSISS